MRFKTVKKENMEESKVKIFVMPEKPKLKFETECFICTDTDENDLHWICLATQFFHLPCLIEIIKNSPCPKNPRTQTLLTKKEIQKIRRLARSLKMFCPKQMYLDLLWQVEKQFASIIELCNILRIPPEQFNIEKTNDGCRTCIFEVAKVYRHRTNDDNKKLIYHLRAKIFNLLANLETKVRELYFSSELPCIFLGEFLFDEEEEIFN